MLGKLFLWTQFTLLLHRNDLLNIIKFLWLPLTVIFQVPPLGPGIKINGVGKKIKTPRSFCALIYQQSSGRKPCNKDCWVYYIDIFSILVLISMNSSSFVLKQSVNEGRCANSYEVKAEDTGYLRKVQFHLYFMCSVGGQWHFTPRSSKVWHRQNQRFQTLEWRTLMEKCALSCWHPLAIKQK